MRASGRRRSGFLPFLATVLFVGSAVVLAGLLPFRQVLAQNRAVDLAEEKLAAIQEENRLLEERIAALQTPQEVERLAREQFGLVRPGETGYVVVIPPDDRPPDPVEADQPPVEDDPWWRDVWDFLTGRDLLEDG